MIRAHLNVSTCDRKMAGSIVDAVAPDNLIMSGLRIGTRTKVDSAQFTMSFEGKIETFISTLDDMLACIQAATRTLKRITSRAE